MPSLKPLKGRVECRDGITEDSLLAAIIDAASDDDSSVKLLLNKIESLIAMVAGSLALKSDEAICWDFNKEQKSESATIQIFQQTSKGLSIWRGEGVSLEKIQSSFASRNSDSIPNWVIETFVKILSQLLQDKSKTPEEILVNQDSLLFVLGSLLLLFEMGVSHLSYSPIPIDSLEPAWRKPLLINMAVCMNGDGASTRAKSTPMGVAILRVLSCTFQTGQPFPSDSFSWTVLRFIGNGTSKTGTTKVTIMVCEAALDKTSYGLEDKHEIDCSKILNDAQLHKKCDNPFESNDLWMQDTITHMETNLDDITGENLAFIIELLMNNGAIDAWATPIVMKKGRPAHTLHCLCKHDDDSNETAKVLLELIFRHSTTLGVRIYQALPRAKLCRSMVTVQTPYVETSRKGLVDVKMSKFKNGQVISSKAEFDHCKEIAVETGVPLKRVSEDAVAIARRKEEA